MSKVTNGVALPLFLLLIENKYCL